MRQSAKLLVAGAAAAVAAPCFVKYHGSPVALTTGVAVFAILPGIAGVVCQTPLRAAMRTAGVFLVLCPLVYVLTDPLSQTFERARDAFFLLTGAVTVYTTAAWAAEFARRGSRLQLVMTVVFALMAVGAVGLMVLLLVYLE